MQKSVDFKGMISQYKKDHFIKVETVHHEFLYSQFHPKDKDLVINLERNYFPKSLKIFDVKDVNEKGGQDDMGIGNLYGEGENSMADDQSHEGDQHLNLDNKYVSNIEVPAADAVSPDQIQLENKDKPEEKAKEFNFADPITYKRRNKESQPMKQRYAISLWRINQGNQALQEKEFPIKGEPYMQRFYISTDGNVLYYFLCEKPKEEGESPIIKEVVFLNIDPLNKQKKKMLEPVWVNIKLPLDLKLAHITDACLSQFTVNRKKEYYLYLRSNINNYFIKNMKIVWQFSALWDEPKAKKEEAKIEDKKDGDEEENKDDEQKEESEEEEGYGEDYYKSDEYRDQNWYFYHLQYSKWNIKKVMFKPTDDQYIYVLASSKHNEQYHLFKVKWDTKPEKMFNEGQIYVFENDDIYNATDIVYNNDLSYISFNLYGQIIVMSIKLDPETKKEVVNFQTLETNDYNCFLKSSFLHLEQWAIYYMADSTYIIDLTDFKNYKEIKYFDLGYGNSPLTDIAIINKTEFGIIGTYNQYNKSSIQINYLNSKNEIIENNIQEISERRCLHPLIFFAKGSQELMIQSIEHPERVLRMELKEDDVFLCFIDINHQIQIKSENTYARTARMNETLAFLTQNNDKIYVNIVCINNSNGSEEFLLYKSLLFISRKDLKYGPIVKAVFLKASRKEVKGGVDYLLMMQYRTQITIKSFISPYIYIEKMPIVQVPFIFNENENQDFLDTIYYLVKDGPTIKMQRLRYDKSKDENNITLYEFKSNNAFLFEDHYDYVYIMDENKQIRRLQFDNSGDKVTTEMFDFIASNKDIMEENGIISMFNSIFHQYYLDYDEVSITDTTLYLYDKAYVFHGTKDHSKNYEYTKERKIFSGDSLTVIQGATKINGMNNLMYVVKGIETEEFYNKQQDLTRKPEEDKQQSKTAGLLAVVNNLVGNKQNVGSKLAPKVVDQTIDDEDFNIEDDESFHKPMIQSNTAAGFGFMSSPSEQPPVNMSINHNLYEGEDDDSEDHKTYITIIPYIDSNELSIKYNNVESPIEMTSFINQNDDILVMMQESSNLIFQIFSKNGHYLYNPQFFSKENKRININKEYSSLKLLQITDNLKYLLFQYNEYIEAEYTYKYRLVWFENVKENNRTKFVFIGEQEDFNHDLYDYGFLKCKAFLDNEANLYQLVLQNLTEEEKKSDDFKYFILYKNAVEFFPKIKDYSYILSGKNPNEWEAQYNIEWAFTQNYLFLIIDRQIEFFRLDQVNQYAEQVNLELDESITIKRIITTERDNLIQIVFSNSITQSLYIATWDLEKNIEYSMLEVPEDENKYNEYKIIKGVKQKLNYIIHDNNFYDMQFLLPFTFFKCEEDNITIYPVNEKKLSSNNTKYLGLYEKDKLFNGYSLLDLYFWEHMSELKLDDWNQSLIHLQYFTQRYQSNTIFHCYVLESKIIQMIYEEVIKREQEMDNNYYKQIFFNIIYPNKELVTPFMLAIQAQSPKSVEAMLEMMISQPDYSFSPFIMQNFKELFAMGLTSFERYLDICFFKHPSLKETKTIKWTIDAEEEYIDFHTSYIGNAFYKRLLNQKKIEQTGAEKKKILQDKKKQEQKKKQMEELMRQKSLQKKEDSKTQQTQQQHGDQNAINNEKEQEEGVDEEVQNLEEIKESVDDQENVNEYSYLKEEEQQKNENLTASNVAAKLSTAIVTKLKRNQPKPNELDIFLPKKKTEGEDENNDLKRVEFSIIEFDWIFKGDNAIEFIRNLAETDNDNLFAISSIKIIIQFLWKKFFVRILLFIFLPFISYMCFFLVYITYVYQMRRNYPDDKFYEQLQLGFAIVVLIHIFVFFMLEVRQMFLNKLGYLTSFWNIIDLISVSLNLAFVICDLTYVDILKVYPLGAGCALLMWVKLFYFLRLFQPTASMIRMIVQICKDMYTFAAVLALAMIGFGNAFYLMALNYYPQYDDDGNIVEIEVFTGGNFLMALIYSFRTGLGDFSTDSYGDVSSDPWLWIIFLLCAILIQIVLLNLLIAIMGDTYDKVTEISEQSKLKEMCSMISENEFVLRREKVFRNSKYIIVANLEKAETNNSGSWEGKIAALKTCFSQMMIESRKEFKGGLDSLKTEMANNYKTIDQRFEELQSNGTRQSQQILQELKSLNQKIHEQQIQQ